MFYKINELLEDGLKSFHCEGKKIIELSKNENIGVEPINFDNFFEFRFAAKIT